MSDYETLRKQYSEAFTEYTNASQKYNNLAREFYSAYINSDKVKNTAGKCFRNKETDEVLRVIEPEFFRCGRSSNSFTENRYICLVVEPQLEFVPEDFQEYIPINLNSVYITNNANLEEITLEEFNKEYEAALESFNGFIEYEIETAKNTPVPKPVFRF